MVSPYFLNKLLRLQIEVRDHSTKEPSKDDSEPISITLNSNRSLLFDGNEVAVIPKSDIAGRYTSQKYIGNQNCNSQGCAFETEEEAADAKPVPAPRNLSLRRRPSSAGLTFKKPILTCDDLQPTGPPDRTYKVILL